MSSTLHTEATAGHAPTIENVVNGALAAGGRSFAQTGKQPDAALAMLLEALNARPNKKLLEAADLCVDLLVERSAQASAVKDSVY